MPTTGRVDDGMQGRREIHVMAGVLSDATGRVLVARRPAGKHLAGRWEFPGGKLDGDEAPLAGLRRELEEELGVALESAEPLIRLRHDYHDQRVLLDVWRVTRYSGTPHGRDAQALDWVMPDDLPGIDLLEADRPVITALRLPPVARCISGLEGLLDAARAGRAETLFWSLAQGGTQPAAAREAVREARRAGHRVLVAGAGVDAAVAAASTGADGLLLDPTDETMTLDPRGAFLVGAICPTPAAATSAAAAGAHFLVLAPVADRAGERAFAETIPQLGLPVYLGWYADAGHLELARSTGAHGCAVGPLGAASS